MQAWLATSLVRHFPASRARRRDRLTLRAARSSTVSFQVAFRNDTEQVRRVELAVKAPQPIAVQVRRVGYVPLHHFSTPRPADDLDGVGHLPGLVPDPLFPESACQAGAFETNAFWLTVRVPVAAPPGRRPVTVTLTVDGQPLPPLTATVVVHRGVLPPRRDFPVTQWFYADALCDWYHTELYHESFWPLLAAYLKDLAEHGVDTSHIPAFTPPTDGVKRPTQLVRVRRDGDRYLFDWTLVLRWLQTAQAQGLKHFEWNHLFTQWGAQHAIRIYEGHGETKRLLWPPETPATSPVYRAFLAQFLPEFHRFLCERGVLEQSFFHLSDEPHGDAHLANYRAARQMLRELAPWMKVMDALSEIAFAREGLTDTPIPVLSSAPEFVREGVPAWTYFWSGPHGRYLNRLLDTPLPKIRMAGWLFWRLRAQGFLHWGYNYWYRSQTTELINPYHVNDAHDWPGWSPGDPFVVYPGEAGPVDSLRWEVWAESLEDYALLQAVGVDPDNPMLAEIQDYAEFPRDARWMEARRRELLRRLPG